MPAISGRRRHRALAAVLCCALPAASSAAAQDAAYFSPTFAASHGSPYSEIYARTFGAPPLETAAPAPAAAPADAPAPSVVYVIENDRLLTYSATDFARGGAQALAGAALPTAPAGGRLYGAIPPAPADSGDAVPLLPQN